MSAFNDPEVAAYVRDVEAEIHHLRSYAEQRFRDGLDAALGAVLGRMVCSATGYADEIAYDQAVTDCAEAIRRLMKSRHELVTSTPPSVSAETSRSRSPGTTGADTLAGGGTISQSGVGVQTEPDDLIDAYRDPIFVLEDFERDHRGPEDADAWWEGFREAIDTLKTNWTRPDSRTKSGTQMCPSCGMRFRPHGDGMGADLYEREQDWDCARCGQRNDGWATRCGRCEEVRAKTPAERYQRENPLGGPAKMFYAIGDRITAGEDFHFVLRDMVAALIDERPQTGNSSVEDLESRVQWIVNDNGELGVMVDGVARFLYKGQSLIYRDARHDDGTPMFYRIVGKREFGECCYPPDLQIIPRAGAYRRGLTYASGLSLGRPEDGDWKQLPPLESLPLGNDSTECENTQGRSNPTHDQPKP